MKSIIFLFLLFSYSLTVCCNIFDVETFTILDEKGAYDKALVDAAFTTISSSLISTGLIYWLSSYNQTKFSNQITLSKEERLHCSMLLGFIYSFLKGRSIYKERYDYYLSQAPQARIAFLKGELDFLDMVVKSYKEKPFLSQEELQLLQMYEVKLATLFKKNKRFSRAVKSSFNLFKNHFNFQQRLLQESDSLHKRIEIVIADIVVCYSMPIS